MADYYCHLCGKRTGMMGHWKQKTDTFSCQEQPKHSLAFKEGQRYLVKYWPRTFNGFGRDAKRTPYEKIEEVIYKDGNLEGWCGDYKTSTTHTIRLEDVTEVLKGI